MLKTRNNDQWINKLQIYKKSGGDQVALKLIRICENLRPQTRVALMKDQTNVSLYLIGNGIHNKMTVFMRTWQMIKTSVY